jgi:hypothetical protein
VRADFLIYFCAPTYRTTLDYFKQQILVAAEEIKIIAIIENENWYMMKYYIDNFQIHQERILNRKIIKYPLYH